ncbi:MAG: hypothetical protein ABFS03_12380 [Chloroflexota bacterium]
MVIESETLVYPLWGLVSGKNKDGDQEKSEDQGGDILSRKYFLKHVHHPFAEPGLGFRGYSILVSALFILDVQ